MSLKPKKEEGARRTPEEIEADRAALKKAASDKAALKEKVRYRSECDATRFKEFLTNRLQIWDREKSETFHAQKMFDKTTLLLSTFEVN